MFSTGFPHPEGKFEGTYGGKYKIKKDLGIIGFGRDLVSLDSILLHLTESWIITGDNSNLKTIELAKEEGLGLQEKKVFKEAKNKIGYWLSPQSRAPAN
jgi:hypothetical protein